MKKWKLILPIVVIAAVIICVVGVASASMAKSEKNIILDNVYIGSINVGGMTVSEAKKAVSEYTDQLQDETVTLTAKDNSLSVTAGQLGISWKNTDAAEKAVEYGKDGNIFERIAIKNELKKKSKVFSISLTADEGKVTSLLKKKAGKLNQDAVDYGLTRKNGSFVIKEGSDGWKVDADKSLAAINSYFSEGWKAKAEVALVYDTIKAEGSKEELSKVKDILGTFTTYYGSSIPGRKANVANGCSKVNGSLVYPGQEFSVYDTVSPFTTQNGYELAKAYENGTTVDSVGGGICQVSTTLYNAVIRAELKVTERYGHSMIVEYVPPSDDAAIAGTYKDFKFVNNSDAPIYIQGSTNGAYITFTIYGEETRDENREVSFESKVISTTKPTTKFVATSDAIGTVTQTQTAHVGKKAELFKIVKVNGKVQSKTVFNHTTYKMSPNIYSVGTKSSNKKAVAAIKKAIATKDLSKIKAAAAKWKNADSSDTTDESDSSGTKDTDSTESTN